MICQSFVISESPSCMADPTTKLSLTPSARAFPKASLSELA